MKNIFLSIAALSVLASTAFGQAGSVTYEKIVITDTHTNIASNVSAADTNVSKRITGFLDSIILTIAGDGTPNVDIDIVANGSLGQRTLWTQDDATAISVTPYPIRVPITDTSGTTTNDWAKIPLVGDRVTVKMYDSDETNVVDVTAFIVYSPNP